MRDSAAPRLLKNAPAPFKRPNHFKPIRSLLTFKETENG
jgi:hypothetical protein